MFVYEENIKIIKEFYNSDYAKELLKREPQYVKRIVEVIYKDPDIFDKSLVEKANEKSDNNKKENSNDKIIFGPDGICGWKILFDIYDGEISSDWLEKYNVIRGSIHGELFFPSKKQSNSMTLNQQRNIIFGDRIDLTLFDIKSYIEGKETKMSFDAHLDTMEYMKKYKSNCESGFQNFVKETGLEIFVDQNYEVKDLSSGLERKIIIGHEKYKWSNRFGKERKKEILGNYFTNLIGIIESEPKKII